MYEEARMGETPSVFNEFLGAAGLKNKRLNATEDDDSDEELVKRKKSKLRRELRAAIDFYVNGDPYLLVRNLRAEPMTQTMTSSVPETEERQSA